ncbi:MAG TPA: hypothetical protein VFC92_02330 [Bacteroidales bacterium]|nr:hypothetical protein [Bacteroidales bacterium]
MKKTAINLTVESYHRKPMACLFFGKEYMITDEVKSLPGNHARTLILI